MNILYYLLVFVLCYNCATIYNKNVKIEDFSGLYFHKKIKLPQYDMEIYTIGVKSFPQREKLFKNLYPKSTEVLLLSKNQMRGNVIFETLYTITDYESYSEKLSKQIGKEKGVFFI